MSSEGGMENGGEFNSSRRKYRSPALELSSRGNDCIWYLGLISFVQFDNFVFFGFGPVKEDGGIGVANGEGKLGLGRMCSVPFPFSLNQSLRLIVVGSVLSLTFVGVLFVWSILRALVRPCSRLFSFLRVFAVFIEQSSTCNWQTQPVI